MRNQIHNQKITTNKQQIKLLNLNFTYYLIGWFITQISSSLLTPWIHSLNSWEIAILSFLSRVNDLVKISVSEEVIKSSIFFLFLIKLETPINKLQKRISRSTNKLILLSIKSKITKKDMYQLFPFFILDLKSSLLIQSEYLLNHSELSPVLTKLQN